MNEEDDKSEEKESEPKEEEEKTDGARFEEEIEKLFTE